MAKPALQQFMERDGWHLHGNYDVSPEGIDEEGKGFDDDENPINKLTLTDLVREGLKPTRAQLSRIAAGTAAVHLFELKTAYDEDGKPHREHEKLALYTQGYDREFVSGEHRGTPGTANFT